MFVDKKFLLRCSKPGEKNVWLGLCDLLQNRVQSVSGFLKPPIRTTDAGDLQSGVSKAQVPGRYIRRIWPAAEKEYPQSICGAAPAQILDEVYTGDPGYL
jgi:hypothetical protein